ncbi:DUF294 nucleotidyltransferase-like domain-containing protein [Bacillus sp. Marseille-P3800]|uniref:DUF294 nucleotidyltransferase-like domain-containing protein n=1 Tax=Bacillus sp. Marseille-P3800 TaxID=2014782 RepID=UPI000C082FCA|nr:DUF294 nucleotidyltransferase-like domain-containing protein [Bacillus sp. Marseille-P3800]
MAKQSEAVQTRLDSLEERRVKTVQDVITRSKKELGEIPAPFAFFFMGSAGREEQLYGTDQDHGIVYDGNQEDQSYFLQLGENIVEALEQAGYERCPGGVMASNQRWCQSITDWEAQLLFWIKENKFEHVRYLLTFFDARCVWGQETLLFNLKQLIFDKIDEGLMTMDRFAENTGRIPKGLNGFGQLLEETYGEHQGTINMKEQVLFPYVNGMRLMALKEGIQAASTLKRMEQSHFMNTFKREMESFVAIQNYRVMWGERHGTFTYVFPQSLSKKERKFLKNCIKEGRSFYKRIQEDVGRELQ